MTVDLEETLGRLLQIESSEIPILSVYLNIHPERFDKLFLQPRLNELLRPDEQAADSGRLEHKAKVSLREAVKRVLEMGPGLETSTDVSVAIFECPALGIDEVVGLPRQVWDTAMAGPTPYLRPLRAVIDELRTVAAVVLDTRHAEINVFRIGELLDRQVIEVEELRKSNLAGWFGLEEYRHRQHAEEVHHHLYREVSRRLERMQRDQGVDLVFIGGKQSSTDPLLPSLHPRVREISRTFVIDLHTLTPAILAKTVAQLEEDYEREEEERMVEEVYSMAAAGDLAALGVDRVADAVNLHAVAQLLIHDGVATPGARCGSCGALSRPRPRCVLCGGKTTQVSDLLEAMASAVGESGGRVEHVTAGTRLESDLAAASLRYSIW